jgi:hypothetical protein
VLAKTSHALVLQDSLAEDGTSSLASFAVQSDDLLDLLE